MKENTKKELEHIFANLDEFQRTIILNLENLKFIFPSEFDNRSGGRILSPQEIESGIFWTYAIIQCINCQQIEVVIRKERLNANCARCGNKFLNENI